VGVTVYGHFTLAARAVEKTTIIAANGEGKFFHIGAEFSCISEKWVKFLQFNSHKSSKSLFSTNLSLFMSLIVARKGFKIKT
jgi:hypothetical protein